MSGIKTIAVFCGSRNGKKPSYLAAAKALGEALAAEKINLVYGGGNNGLMGVIGKAVFDGGSKVTGIIPNLGWDVSITYGETINVETLQDRKSKMVNMGDAYIALPGGFGTMNELMEVVETYQLGLHNKPVGVLNTDNYYDKMLEWVENSISQEFMYSRGRDTIVSDSDPVRLIKRLQAKCNEIPKESIVNGKIVV